MKPTYGELLEMLFEVTEALRTTLVQGGQITSADKDRRWTITHKAEVICGAWRATPPPRREGVWR